MFAYRKWQCLRFGLKGSDEWNWQGFHDTPLSKDSRLCSCCFLYWKSSQFVVHVLQFLWLYGYGSIPINTIFRGMNIHLPAILMFTRGTRVWTNSHLSPSGLQKCSQQIKHRFVSPMSAPSPEVRTLFIAAFLPFFRTEAGGAGRPPIELKLCTRYVVSTCFNMFQRGS